MSPARPLITRAKPRRPWALWLALCLAVFGALAPTVSHALQWVQGGSASVIEVCTSTGPRWIVLRQVWEDAGTAADGSAVAADANADTDAAGVPAALQLFDHCPFCLLYADRAAPPPLGGLGSLVLVGRAVAPVDYQRVFYPIFFAPAPPPRGPPHSA